MKWFQDGKGNTSMMRIGAMIAEVMGAITIIAALIGFSQQLPDSAAIVASGAGLISIVLTAKAWQSKSGG